MPFTKFYDSKESTIYQALGILDTWKQREQLPSSAATNLQPTTRIVGVRVQIWEVIPHARAGSAAWLRCCDSSEPALFPATAPRWRTCRKWTRLAPATRESPLRRAPLLCPARIWRGKQGSIGPRLRLDQWPPRPAGMSRWPVWAGRVPIASSSGT